MHAPNLRLTALSLLLCVTGAACAKGASEDNGGDLGSFPDAGRLPDASMGGPDASTGPTPAVLSHSNSMTVTPDHSVACFNAELGYTLEASYYRIFDLSGLGIDKPLSVSKVSVGIENAVAGVGNTQPATVRLHSLSAAPVGGIFQQANLSAIGSSAINVIDQEATVLDVPLTATVPVGTTLVVEFLVPDGTTDNHLLFPGSNEAGQTGPTYVRDGCGGAEEPIDLAELDITNMHWVVSVTGEY